MAILRYPLNPPVAGGDRSTSADATTTAIDYVMFQRMTTEYKNDSESQYYGGYSIPQNGIEVKPFDTRVYIAMPKSIQTAYTSNYRDIDLGVAGASAMKYLGGDVTNMGNLTSILQDATGAALPEFSGAMISQFVNGLTGLGGLTGQIDANAIQALTRGRVFNPFKEKLFTGMSFRTHSFNFKMVSRNQEEAVAVRAIINYFKQGATPSTTGVKGGVPQAKVTGDGAGAVLAGGINSLSGQRFFQVPQSFNIKFMRVAADGTIADTETNDYMHFKFHPSVITNISVNYTPDGQYTSFKQYNTSQGGVQVPAIDLSIQFAELKLVTAEDINQGF
ncbi:baseplate tail tube cap [Synechococcus phage S-H25]|nr:baseplate tail tube cap [Synechococcus phage S-H25]